MKKLLVSVLSLGMAVCAVSGTAFALTNASAGNTFKADTEGTAVNPGGKETSTIMTALDNKIVALNADIQAALDAGKELSTAYAEGDIIVYSIANGSNGLLDSDNKRSGWKVWEGVPLMDLKYLNAGYGGWGDNYVGWMTYNGVKDEAYIITAEFANTFQSNQKIGPAASDMFTVGSITYQNFTNGYMKRENGTVTVVDKKNVSLDGETVTEVAADPTSTGIIGAATEATLTKAGTDKEEFAKAFSDAYKKYADAGYNVGYPFSTVMDDGKNSGGDARYGTLCSQNFRWGDSVCDPWNDSGRSQWAALAYNFEQKAVYLITDEFWSAFEKVAQHVTELGDPVGDAFLATDGNRYQNYTKGYMKAEGATAQNKNATVVLSKNVDASGAEYGLDAASRIGRLGASVTEEVLPNGFTAETFTAAVKEAYTDKVAYASDEEFVSAELVSYENGFISQKYTDNKGKVHMLAYSASENDFVYLRPAVVSIFNSNTTIGAPVSARIQVAETESQTIYAYPFANGYIKLTVSEQYEIVGGLPVAVTNEAAVATVGATYDKEKVFFETVSYADSINASLVNAATSQAYAFLNIPDAETLAAKFREAYEAAFAVGFSAGKPASEGITWWTTGNSGVIKLTLAGGNGNASFWGDNTLMTYNPADGKVYITTGMVGSHYGNDGASGNGWALGEMKINTKTGVIVQQFDIHDTVVESRPIYIIVENGTSNKVSGMYDFEANANGGEWVDYITQFGGSISKKVFSADEYKVGDDISIDFSKYIDNEDGYNVTYTLVSETGALSEAGVFTTKASAAGKIVVKVEAYSAFDKLTFDVELTVKGEDSGNEGNGGNSGSSSEQPSTPPASDSESKPSSGCGSVAMGAGIAAATAAVAAVAFVAKKKREDE